MIVIIAQEFKDDYTTREAGERLRRLILQSDYPITLDFSGIKIASASFFDESIAKLSEVDPKWSAKDIISKIKFENIFSKDLDLVKQTCKIRGVILPL